MNKNIKIIILISATLIGTIFFAYWWLNKYFFRTDDSYPPKLFDFKPEKLNYCSNKPIYFYANDSLYFDSLGTINLKNKPIWTKSINIGNGREHGIFISPNSQFIAFNESSNKIIVIDRNGNLKHIIETFEKTIIDNATFWGKELQWNENSTKLYFMQYRKWDAFLSKNNRSTLYVYTIKENRINKIIDLQEECCEDFYISRDEKTIIYRFVDNKGNMPFKKINTSNGMYEGQFTWDRWHKLSEPKDKIFINYSVDHFGNFSQDYKHLITTVGFVAEPGLYYYSDTLTSLIIKGKYGYGAFKGNSYSYRESGEFLPWNKYYVCRINSVNVKGTIIIDIASHKYDFIDKEVYCFFSITNNEPFDFDKDIYETSIQNRIK